MTATVIPFKPKPLCACGKKVFAYVGTRKGDPPTVPLCEECFRKFTKAEKAKS